MDPSHRSKLEHDVDGGLRALHRLALPDLAPGQELLERDAPRSSAPPKLGLEQDRPPAILAEADLVLGGAHAMRAEVGIRELAECAGADEAADAVFRDGLPRIR